MTSTHRILHTRPLLTRTRVRAPTAHGFTSPYSQTRPPAPICSSCSQPSPHKQPLASSGMQSCKQTAPYGGQQRPCHTCTRSGFTQCVPLPCVPCMSYLRGGRRHLGVHAGRQHACDVVVQPEVHRVRRRVAYDGQREAAVQACKGSGDRGRQFGLPLGRPRAHQ